MSDGQQFVNKDLHVSGVATRLAQVRADLGLVSRGFAAGLSEVGLNVSHTSVMEYEKGTTVPVPYLAAVCEAYDINPAYLIWGEPPERREPPTLAAKKLRAVREVLDATESDLIRVVRQIPARDE